MITDYHAKYFAWELSKRCPPDSIEKITSTLADAQVDLNPHQVDAALFAFRSPFSKGVLLADEVGLGKTIEAGLVLSQRWAERRRKILIIVPSSLRKQWNQELLDKFFVPSLILESKTFNDFVKRGVSNPFDQKDIAVICSYHFARSKEEYLRLVKWDLVVLDEAHRLRNVYKKSNKIARSIKESVSNAPKLLLTATPLQNSLLELYGLVSFIDDYVFGDVKSFKSQFVYLNDEQLYADLRTRLVPVCKRTLRRQVTEYINYTNRMALVQEFIPTPEEQKLYDLVSEYLQRDHLYALPSSQRQLITLILRKLLASSTFAIAKTLHSLINRLQIFVKEAEKARKEEISESLSADYEGLDATKDEWNEENGQEEESDTITQEQIEEIKAEIKDLESFRDLAESITHNAKGNEMMKALKMGFKQAEKFGADEKALIFTESRRTQDYLFNLLSQTEYKDKIVMFNGTNNDDLAKSIYKQWLEKHKGTDVITGSKSADTRAALVDYFKNHASIMIATESGAEGINLQFCSLVINYDLPWNPQRIEQRIGRCHRYGQKYDVVVVNFLNKTNAADQRIYQLLDEKFKLFSGVFGASDDVLGAIESGVDFEKRIATIYQQCRTPEDIQQYFDELQKELEEKIADRMASTRQNLLEHFDEEVHEKLRVNLVESRDYLSKYEVLLWDLTKYYLKDHADFSSDSYSFMLKSKCFEDIPDISLGPYRMAKNVEDAHLYRIGHPIAQKVFAMAKSKELTKAYLQFDYCNSSKKITILEELVGKSGFLSAYALTIESISDEDYLILAGADNEGNSLSPEQSYRLFSLDAKVIPGNSEVDTAKTQELLNNQRGEILKNIDVRNSTFFDEEMDKLDKWAQDKKKTLRENIKDIDENIKELRRQARTAPNLPEKVKIQKQIKGIESKREALWKELDDACREVDKRKESLIDDVEKQLGQKVSEQELFTIKWEVV
ncbi:MAG: DEAD/DEAH box helicase [Desulfuromonas sp. SDB]|nr:MAG: DEAD/DEAH box helicase [Desulfuromonas sp. SDB]